MSASAMPGRRRLSSGQILAWAILLAMLALTLAPLWMMVKTALISPDDVFVDSANWLPSGITFNNVLRVLGLADSGSGSIGVSAASIDFSRALLNSVMFTGIIVVCQTTCAAMSAYAFARLDFPGNKLIFALFLGSMMVPGVVTFIPNFILIKDLGWLNTLQGMVAPFCLMQGFSVFFLRQFFLAVPRELEEAARLDGATHWFIFRRVVLPLSVTPLVTIAVLTGINMWNEFFWPYLVSKDEAWQVLPLALQTFKSQSPNGQPDWTGLMAAASITMVPTVLLLLFMGRRVVESVAFSGGK
ncbi:carbohydrate ABC transporter permease [Amphibiibacter pelophylacis]|uniref:Carbohydrate ABC transporter permease n=1 Tax=Amphibiibacter pelophylacis TaxID=1799477 RepID=A0ACC6NZ18_9BURK